MIKPIRNQVLVKCFKGEEKSQGGIFVPEAYQKESNKVQIIEVGNGTQKRSMKLKRGEIAYRVKDWGEPVEHNGELYYLMDDKSILAIEQ